MKRKPAHHQRYGLAVTVTVLAVLIRWILEPVIGAASPFLLFAPAVMISAWYGGLGPGLLSTFIAALAADFLFLPVEETFAADYPQNIARFVVFLLVALLISILVIPRRRAEEALQQTNETLQALIQASPVAIISLDPDGKVKMWSPAAERIFGWGEKDVLGKPYPVVPKGREQEFRANLDLALSGKALSGLGAQSEKQDGTLINIASYTAQLHDRKGNINGIMAIVADITERIRAEKALEESRHYLQAVVETSPALVVVADADGHIQLFNRACEELTGYSRDEVLGRTIVEMFLPQDRVPAVQSRFANPYSPEAQAPHVNPWITKSGQQRMIEWRRTPFLTAEDGRPLILATGIDITERLEAEEERSLLLHREQEARRQAEQANRVKDDFLATVSHELRTPLNGIRGWAEILRRGMLDEERASRALNTIIQNVDLQSKLIGDLLDISRMVAGKLSVDLRPVELAPIIKAAIEVVQPTASAKNIHMNHEFDSSVGPVLGDSDRLQQVVWNLLTNAVKFTSQGGRVEVRLERIDSSAQISVIDTGKGIDAESLPHIFDRFYQVEGKGSKKQEGLGLGMAIVRHLVEMHGGQVLAQSPGEGQGTAIRVKIPMMAVELDEEEFASIASVTRSGSPFSCPVRLDGLRVLVVDDSLKARDLIRATLESCGAEVTAVGTVGQALELLSDRQANRRVDVLVSDLSMPGEDGHMLIRKVRVLEGEQLGGRIPAVALTSHSATKDRAKALSAGFQAFLVKPVKPAELITTVGGVASLTAPD